MLTGIKFCNGCPSRFTSCCSTALISCQADSESLVFSRLSSLLYPRFLIIKLTFIACLLAIAQVSIYSPAEGCRRPPMGLFLHTLVYLTTKLLCVLPQSKRLRPDFAFGCFHLAIIDRTQTRWWQLRLCYRGSAKSCTTNMTYTVLEAIAYFPKPKNEQKTEQQEHSPSNPFAYGGIHVSISKEDWQIRPRLRLGQDVTRGPLSRPVRQQKTHDDVGRHHTMARRLIGYHKKPRKDNGHKRISPSPSRVVH